MWIYLGFLTLQVSDVIKYYAQCLILCVQFILALGNRPKGEVGLYVTTFAVYAVLSAYLIFCSIFLTVKAFGVCHDRHSHLVVLKL